jgi:MoaA/NifB/PqqE/SkfB family radical SAM enzyme
MSIYKNIINYIETDNGIEKIEENVNDILLRKDNKYTGWLCWSGIYSLSITPDGSIYNSTCGIKKMGNIFEDDEIKLYTKPHVCTRKWCSCAADLNIKKIKNEKYIDLVRPDKVTPKMLEVELTNICNLECPLCIRAKLSKTLYLKEKKVLDISLFDKLDLSKIRFVDLCGSISEPTFHPEFFDFINKFNSNTGFGISTNGSTHNKKWWRKLGEILKKHKGSYVIFPLDGLEDTHSIYRIGSNFNKVIDNIRAFNESGTTSYAQLILFKHNQHQIEDVKKLASEIGCKELIIRTSIFYEGKFERPNIWDVKTRREVCEIGDKRKIICKHRSKETIFITCDGYVIPCCFLCKSIYEPEVCLSNHQLFQKEIDLFLKHKDEIDLYKNDLDKILESEFFFTIYKQYKDIHTCNIFCKLEGKSFLKKSELYNES